MTEWLPGIHRFPRLKLADKAEFSLLPSREKVPRRGG